MRFAFSNAPHNYVSSPDNMVMYTRSIAPGASDGVAVGQLWLDTSTNPGTIKECTSISPVTWVAVSGSGGTPGGSDTQVQFNDGGTTFAGSSGLTYNKTTHVLTATGGFAGNASTVTNGVYTTDTGTVTNTMLAGSIAASKIIGTAATGGGTCSGACSGTNTGDQTLPTDATISTSDVTTNNVSTSKHGWAPKLDNTATHFLNGQGGWTTPAGTYTTPLTTKGDIEVYDSANSRLAVGADGTVLYADSTQTAGLGYDLPVIDLSRSTLLYMDFLKNAATAENTPETQSSGTGASVSFVENFSTNGNNMGIALCTTGTTTTGYASIAKTNFYPSNGQLIFSTAVYVDALSNGTDTYTINVGLLGAANAVAVNNGIYCSYTHGTNSGNWVCVCNDGSSSTSNTSTAVASATWTNVTIVVNANASSVTFYIGHTLVATITTHIPTASPFNAGAIIVKSAGTTAVNLRDDYIAVRKDFSNRR